MEYEEILNVFLALSGVMLLFFLIMLILSLIPVIVTLIAQTKVNQKAGRPGWAAWIPYYSQYVRAEMGGDVDNFWWMLVGNGISVMIQLLNPYVESQGLLALLSLMSFAASIIVLVYAIKIEYNLTLAFRQNPAFTAGLVILPYIFYPILAWGKSSYHGYTEYNDCPEYNTPAYETQPEKTEQSPDNNV